MAIPPQFLKNTKTDYAPPGDIPVGPSDTGAKNKAANKALGLHAAHAKSAKKKKPHQRGIPAKGEGPVDLIPSGPMKGKDPAMLNKGKNAKRAALLAHLKKGK